MRTQSFTILEDRPKAEQYDVVIRSFRSYEAAERFLRKRYTADERNGKCQICRPYIRNDADVVEAA